MIGMRMRYDRSFDWTPRIDVEPAGRAVQTVGGKFEQGHFIYYAGARGPATWSTNASIVACAMGW
jgi:hypothetical protein